MHPAALAMTEEDVALYRREGYFIVRGAVAADHLATLQALYTHIQVCVANVG